MTDQDDNTSPLVLGERLRELARARTEEARLQYQSSEEQGRLRGAARAYEHAADLLRESMRGTGRTTRMLTQAASQPEHIPIVLVGVDYWHATQLKRRIVGMGVDPARVRALDRSQAEKLRGLGCRTYIDHHAMDMMSIDVRQEWSLNAAGADTWPAEAAP